jgi:nitroimidazol reductase NimA-like FMN-containing flavoprotein (pyridoxamine 5'-phosphate oxidase superfamily)
MSSRSAPAAQPSKVLTKVRRFPKRGRYDRVTIASILDAGIMCHVAFTYEGVAACIPMLYWHDAEYIYIHGSRSGRLMTAVAGQSVCVTVTHLDGLVLTRSAFHHSANYRSVCVFGVAQQIDGERERHDQLRAMMERLFPGRWSSLRPVRRKELSATRILAVPLSSASAKVRAGPPDEDPTDLTWPVWGGVIPLVTSPGAPIADAAAVSQAAPALAVPVELR